jgi:hypothetical protein
LSTVINPESASKFRKKLLQHVALALRACASEEGAQGEYKDILAFIVLSLHAIASSVDQTATAWERRGYWIKADRFRLEWKWAEDAETTLAQALKIEDWKVAARVGSDLAVRLKDVHISNRMAKTQPWVGAWLCWSVESEKV